MVNNIGQWDVSTLTKFVRDIFQTQPPQLLPTLVSEELRVTRKLTVDDQADFGMQRVFHYVGTVGNAGFQNAWVNFGAPYDGAGYVRTVDNFIRLHGRIKTGTIGTVAFTLPPGYRPSTSVECPVVSNGAFGYVTIGTDGTVTISAGSNVSVSLDGVAFKRSIITDTQ